MSSLINNILTDKSYASLKSSEEDENKQKKNLVIKREGNFYCTYIVDAKGQMILLNKIPTDQVEEKKTLGTQKKSDEVKPCDYNTIKNARTAFECKQQTNIEVTHKKNLKEIMNILREYAGIPTDSNKTYDY